MVFSWLSAAPRLSLRGPFSQTTVAARDTKQNCNFVRRPTPPKTRQWGADSGQATGRLRKLFTIRVTSNDACFELHTSRFMQHEIDSRFMAHASLCMLHAASFMLDAAGFMIHGPCFMAYASRASFMIHEPTVIHGSCLMLHAAGFTRDS